MDRISDRIETFFNHLGTQLENWLSAQNWLDIALALLIIVALVLLRGPLARLSVRFIVFIGRSIGVVISKDVQSAIGPAARTAIVAFAFLLAVELIDLPAAIATPVDRILISIIVAAVFSSAYLMTRPLSVLLDRYRTTSTQFQVDWLLRIIQAVVVFLGMAAVLAVWGIDLGPLLTGMGVLGAGVALAAQDIVRNLLGGMTNLSERRFMAGDWIRVEGQVDGFVEKVEFRSTQIRRFDQALVHVPNGDLANSPLINFSRMSHRRIYWKISLVYATTIEQLDEVRDRIITFIDSSGKFVPPDEASRFVRVDSFDDSAINLLVYCFTRSADFGDYLAAKEDLAKGIMTAVQDTSTAFAFPSRSIYVEASAESGPDQFSESDGQEIATPTQKASQ